MIENVQSIILYSLNINHSYEGKMKLYNMNKKNSPILMVVALDELVQCQYLMNLLYAENRKRNPGI